MDGPLEHKGALGHSPSKDAPGDKRRQQIMVAGTVILVAFGYLALRKQGSATGTSPAAATPSDNGGGGGASGGMDATAQSTYAAQLNSMTGQLAQLAQGETDLATALANMKTGNVTNITNNYTDHTHHTVKPVSDITNKDTKKKTNTVQPAAAQSASSTHYTVKQGDTLSSIGKRFGESWQAIYAANSKTIEATAKAHGKTSASGPDKSKGWWIYPGEVLNLVKPKAKTPTNAGATKKTNPAPVPHPANGVKTSTTPHPANGVKGIPKTAVKKT